LAALKCGVARRDCIGSVAYAARTGFNRVAVAVILILIALDAT